ncbi:MAG: glycosyltransferase family 2 protein [Chloroflexi bacterium]|nr:glycosyltransferase family 2 protein [Chloroflexota bacterium]
MSADAPAGQDRLSVSAILVSYNTRYLLAEAISSLEGASGVEIIVVDNASSDGSAELVEAAFPHVKLVRAGANLGFAAGVNRGAEQAAARTLLLLNPDAALQPGALARLLQPLAERPRAAAVGSALRYGDGRAQDAAFRFPGLAQVVLDLFPVPRLAATGVNGRYPSRAPLRPFRVDHPLGACMLIRRAAWEDVGTLDPGYFMYVEEVDWCRRARARGWEVWYEPRAVAIHHAGQSSRQHEGLMFEQLWRSRLRYFHRYHGRTFTALLRLIVRLGMRAERRRARRQGNLARADAASTVLRLAA